ncbi:MAG: PqqD family protein [Desulfotalea sp.]
MLFPKKKNIPTPTREEALAAIPIINPTVDISIQKNNCLRLSYPLAMKPMFSDILQKFTNRVNEESIKKLDLDQYGSEVWNLIDDKRNVRQIILLFSKKNKISNHEAEQSVTSFFRDLGKRKLIAMS